MAWSPYIRAGLIKPLLLQHMTDHMGVYLYYGSRRAQPARVRSFIEFALERLSNQTAFMLTDDEQRDRQAQTSGV